MGSLSSRQRVLAVQEESMSKQPATKRRRLHESPAANMDSLPDAVLQVCFSFIGKGHYHSVAGTCRRFRDVYSGTYEKKTTWKAVAVSVECANHCLENVREEAGDEKNALFEIAIEASMRGQVDILKWAYNSGCVFTEDHFYFAAKNGHAHILQWADERDLAWYTDAVLIGSIGRGMINVLEWILQSGQEIDASLATELAAFKNQLSVLRWLKEQDLLQSEDIWLIATRRGFMNILEWLCEEGYHPHLSVLQVAVRDDMRNIILWARGRGITRYEEKACALAVFYDRLPLLQWLRENDFAWDGNVLLHARLAGHDHILAWATGNGCPAETIPFSW